MGTAAARTRCAFRLSTNERSAHVNGIIYLVGLVVMVFNLLFVNLVSTGLHSYGGV